MYGILRGGGVVCISSAPRGVRRIIVIGHHRRRVKGQVRFAAGHRVLRRRQLTARSDDEPAAVVVLVTAGPVLEVGRRRLPVGLLPSVVFAEPYDRHADQIESRRGRERDHGFH